MQIDVEPLRNDSAAVCQWLNQFAAAVRAGDFSAGRALFAEGVVAFGSVQLICQGRDVLERDQWRDVWPRTSNYQIEPVEYGQNDSLAWAAARWSSIGHNNGESVRRSGRVTFILQCRDGVWQAIHSHHSFDPDPAHRR